METIVQAVVIGMLVMLAGTVPRNLIFAANLRFVDERAVGRPVHRGLSMVLLALLAWCWPPSQLPM